MTVKRISESGTLIAESSAESKSGKRFRAKIIEAGQGSSAFYPARVLEDYASVFRAGTQMYFDHPSAQEEWDRPERSVKDLVGKLVSEATYSPVDEALYAEVEFYPWVAPVLAEMKDDIGLSIRAYGTAEESGNADAPTPVLTSFVEVLSVDVVTRAGAGGALLEMLESARETTLADAEKQITKENDMAVEEKIDALIASVEALTAAQSTLNESLKPVVESLAPKAPDAPAETPAEDAVEIDPIEAAAALSTSGLTAEGQRLALARVSKDVDLAAAIEAQKEYEKAVAEANRPQPGFKINDEGSKHQEAAKGFKGFTKVGN